MAGASPIAPPVQRVLDTLVVSDAPLHQETGCPICAWSKVALNGVANTRIRPSRASSACSCRQPGRRGLRARWAPMPTDYWQPTGTPDHPFWGPAVDARSCTGGARGWPGVEELDDGAVSRSPKSSPGRRRLMRALEPARAPRPCGIRPRRIRRDARPLNRDIKYREELWPFVPATHRDGRQLSSCHRRCTASSIMSGVFPAGSSGARLSRDSTGRSARLQTLARLARRRTHCSAWRRSGIPWLNTSFNVAGNRSSIARSRGIRRSGAAESTRSSQGRSWSPSALRRQGRRGGTNSHDQEAWLDTAPADHIRKRGRVGRGPRARVVAARRRQALARTAGRLSLLIWFGAAPGDDRRSAGSVHLRIFDVDFGSACLPGVCRSAHGGLVVSRLRRPFRSADGQSSFPQAHRRRAPLLRARAVSRLSAARRPADASRASRTERVRAHGQSGHPGAMRIVEIGCGPGRCACIWLVRIGWSSAPI